ncbi:branched-chain amino acid transport protein azlC [Halarchaeum acidiphilum MH1-52-1]|uniref:Branched-chain amino acid transport protein azlC n=1 Tax=Halarchaeum acidiphilum MH1-52-1 TaxID=1261545 RepID=U2YFF0_9EURY|nr:AzlC family ABC transporter permease [Halarchaeum acidiphilum]GAD52751.1 branched-chain amino acid transport protein azlC [Halarchaeum acidiphilum MH1-52-1]
MASQTSFTWQGAYRGARRSLPIAAGVFVYGLVFGILARQSPLTTSEAALMSATVFAASAQFVVLGLWTRPLPVATIVATTFLVNLRHLLMGASLRPWLRERSPAEVYGTLFVLNDESWGLTVSAFGEEERDVAFLLGSGLVVFAGWVAATIIGVSAGGVIRDPSWYGLEFAFVAIYLALLVGIWNGRRDLVPYATAALTAAASSALLGGNWYILVGGLTGSLAGVVRDGATRGFTHAMREADSESRGGEP